MCKVHRGDFTSLRRDEINLGPLKPSTAWNPQTLFEHLKYVLQPQPKRINAKVRFCDDCASIKNHRCRKGCSRLAESGDDRERTIADSQGETSENLHVLLGPGSNFRFSPVNSISRAEQPYTKVRPEEKHSEGYGGGDEQHEFRCGSGSRYDCAPKHHRVEHDCRKHLLD